MHPDISGYISPALECRDVDGDRRQKLCGLKRIMQSPLPFQVNRVGMPEGCSSNGFAERELDKHNQLIPAPQRNDLRFFTNMNSPEKNQFINIEEGTDGLSRAIRAVKAHNRTLLAVGYTDEQIVGIINAAIKECGDDLTVDNFLDRPVVALQAEVDRLVGRETSGAR